MATLVFTKNADDKYETTAIVNGNHNIHLEFDGYSKVALSQKTAGNRFAGKNDATRFVDTYDEDFGNWVYPKTIKIICDKNPLKAELTEV